MCSWNVGDAGGGGGYRERSLYTADNNCSNGINLDEAIVSSRYKLPAKLSSVIRQYPLFIDLIYRNNHTILREYLRNNIKSLDSSSGGSCLIWLPEPVVTLDQDLKQRWSDRFDGNLPDWFENIIDSTECEFERNSDSLAETFEISPDNLPCFIVAEPHQTQCFYDKIDQKDDLEALFNDLVGCALLAKQYPVKRKTKAFRKEWNRRRRKTEKLVKAGVKQIISIFGLVKDLEKSFLDIILPIEPLLESFLACFSHLRKPTNKPLLFLSFVRNWPTTTG